MSKYSPKIDLVFRKLFGSEENKAILVSLLNGILECTPKIQDVTIKNPYNLATYVGGKTSILDIKAVDDKGTWYDIELQIGEQGFYGKRALYYLSKMYADQLESSEEFAKLNKTIGIHLIDFDYFPDERYKRHFVYKDMETNEYIEHLSYNQLYFIELAKFNKDWGEIRTLLDRWMAFLNKAQQLEKNNLPEAFNEDEEIIEAFNKLDVISFNEIEREIYEAERKQRMDAKEEMRTAIEKGKAIGLEEGETIGLQKGETIGLQKGEAIGLQKALNKLIASGMKEDEAKKMLGL